jgi:hypothetical protein
MSRKSREPIIGTWRPRVGDDLDIDDAQHEVQEGSLDWNEWRAARISGQGRQSFAKRPFPSRSWQALFASSPSETTWPYSSEECSAIRATLADDICDDVFGMVIRAAQFYVFAQTQGNRARANPRKEIEQLNRALKELFNSLMRMSPDARDHLQSTIRPFRLPDETPFTTESLREAIDKFTFENRYGLQKLPTAIRGGPRPKNHEGRLKQRLIKAFSLSYNGRPPRNGRPVFLNACFAPLKEFGLRVRATKTWQDVGRIRRKNPAKNS